MAIDSQRLCDFSGKELYTVAMYRQVECSARQGIGYIQ